MSDVTVGPLRPKSVMILMGAFALCFAAAQLGSWATVPNLPWYGGLQKPAFNPPNWAFPVAWSVLYALMAISLWRVATVRPLDSSLRIRAIGVFLVQLAINTTWSFAFFGQQSPALGLVVIGILLVAIVITIFVFQGIDRLAAWLLVPYLAWVGFASLLNTSIWLMNA